MRRVRSRFFDISNSYLGFSLRMKIIFYPQLKCYRIKSFVG